MTWWTTLNKVGFFSVVHIDHSCISTFLYFLHLELPDTFIPITFTLKDREFTSSLNDPNSDDYQTLSAQVRSNVSFTVVIKLNGLNFVFY